MNQLLQFYKDYRDLIFLIKDVVYFIGSYHLIKFLVNWNYKKKTNEIKSNLEFRENIEKQLNEYILDRYKNGSRDIGIRFVYWKNYPRNLTNDAFKNLLYHHSYDERTLPSGWIDNTGINFQDHLWFFGQSIYFDDDGLFFFSKEKTNFKNFKECTGKILILHMPFSSIINFDFKDYIEHEPVFYIKYPYTKYKKLYTDSLIVRERQGEKYSYTELNRRLQINSPHSIKYYFVKLKLKIKSIIKSNP